MKGLACHSSSFWRQLPGTMTLTSAGVLHHGLSRRTGLDDVFIISATPALAECRGPEVDELLEQRVHLVRSSLIDEATQWG